MFGLVGAAGHTPALAQSAIAFVQGNYATPQSPQASVAVTYTVAQTAGNLNVVVVGWNDTTSQVQSVADSSGNVYVRAVGPTVQSGLGTQSIYYAANVAASAAGANTVTVLFNTPANYVDVRIAEYRGIDSVTPVDVVAGSQGSGATSNSGFVTTTNANDLLVGANLVSYLTTAAGAGYTNRMITSPDGDILEDRIVTAVGSYNATASVSGGVWVMQMVAFRAAGSSIDAQPPTAPSALAATALSSTQVNLAWTASTDNVAVTGYRIERCQGPGCATFSQIGTATLTSFSDSTATPSTSYSYRIRATDAAANLSLYSNTASATTPGAPDTEAPTTPGGLAATAASATQINLSWTASTDNVSVTGYRIERCQGTGCSSFAQIGTSTTAAFTDVAAAASITYSYRVRAVDGASNLSGYSNIASATTPSAPDTQPPTAPASLVAGAIMATQLSLSWTASADNVGVSTYAIERCQGAACSTFTQIGTSPTSSYSDTTVAASTSYRYRVRAADAAANLSGYSNIAAATTPPVPDTQSPTIPANLSAVAVSNTQINLAWTASTDNSAVTNYLLERCQGVGCSTFAQVATSITASYSDTGLLASTSYSYRVRATDAASNLSGYSGVASAITPTSAPTVAFVQVNSAVPQTAQATVTVPYMLAQQAGNLNVVVVGWNSSSGTVSSVADSRGNTYVRAVGPTVASGFATQSIYYAPNIASAAANANSVTVTFSAAVPFADIRVAEYSGVTSLNPVDAVAASQGNGTLSDSGPLSTSNATDLLVAGNMVSSTTTGPGASFTSRVITNPDADILEDRVVTSVGTYNATAPMSSGSWIMQLVAFKAGAATPDTQSPTAPGGLTAAAVSGSRIDLSWIAASDNVGVVGYRIERCQGSACASFAEIAAPPGIATTYSDPSVAEATSYTYRVRAADAAGNLGTYSATASTTTPAPDVEPPSAPGTLSASAVSGTQVDVSWGAATDNVNVAGYRLERCEGTGCTAFTKLGTTLTGTSFSDTGLSLSTSYSYIVRAQDATGNLGPYSNVATATTLTVNPQLVAAYSFDEGTGTAVADLSGHGNNGTIANATWTANGKFGKALVFNGANALVTIPDAPALRLTTGMTLEAWVNQPVVNTGWRDIVYKGNDNYYLEASTSAGPPAIGVTVGATQTEAFGATALPVNIWTFLAASYDGSTLRFYINGTQVSSQPRTGPIVTSFNALQIGGDSIYGQFFQGLIDEVRVYSVALSPAQIQADMVTAVGGASPALSLSAASVNFGNQGVGSTSVPTVISATNVGTAALNISGISIGGGQASDFAQTNTCVGTLPPSGSCNISVTFTPTSGGTRNGTLSIADNGPGNPHAIGLTGSGVGFSISPQTVTLTPIVTQQFIVTGAGTSPVVWSVDGIAGGSAANGTVSTAGLYTPPSTPGAHNVTVATTDGTKSATARAHVSTGAGVFTHHNDNARTGQNLNETVLTHANVNASAFGKLASYSIDGIAHASPLYVAGVNIPGLGLRNVVYVATEHDSVYAFDADGRGTTPLWHDTFLGPGVTTVSNTDVGECCDIAPEIGITGTPVINPATGTMYVVVKTKEGTNNYVQRLHALDIATGAEKLGGPVVIQATVPGTGADSTNGQLAFNSFRENQRTALLLHNNIVYFGFGSHGDNQPYHGWLLGYDATTLQRVVAYTTTPNGEGGGIWQSGGGLAIDSAGNFYFATGDGTCTANAGGKDYGNSFLRYNPATGVADSFTPRDQAFLDTNNLDLDAGGMILLPDQPGAHPHLLVSAGKNGTIYLVDRDNMGGYSTTTNRNVQTLENIFPFGTPLPGNYSSPVYFNGTVYFGPVSDVVQAFKLTNGLLSTAPTSTTAQSYPYPGGALSISANGSSNGILWTVRKNGTAAGTLHAYDAANLANELYNSDQAAGARDALDAAAKFSVPVVINGRVYVASEGRLTIFGLRP
jgi:fibronectin type 3 domain-containing protein